MPDLDIVPWRQKGKVSLWRRGTGSPWNFAADHQGCESLAELVRLFAIAERPCKAAIELCATSVVADDSQDTTQFASELTLSYLVDQTTEHHWVLATGNDVYLELGPAKLKEFGQAVADLDRGNGEYTIGCLPDPLWIWWWEDPS